MKKSLPAFLFIVSSYCAFCQPYGNEWINYSQQYLKFDVAQNGIYRIYYSELNSALSSIGVSLSSVDPRNFQVFNKGEEQYIFIEGENDGIFNETDFIEFYGEKNDGTFDSYLFDDPVNQQLHTYTSLINDTAVYYLTWNSSLTNPRIENLTNDLTGIPSPEEYCIYQSLEIFGLPYGDGILSAGVPHAEVYSSTYETGEGFATFNYSVSTFTTTISTPNIYEGVSFTPIIKTLVIGSNEAEHHSVIEVNGEIYADTTFTGYEIVRFSFLVDNLIETNTVEFISGPSSIDFQRYSFIDITYPRTFDFDNASQAAFSVPYSASSDRYIEITDFDEKSTSPLLYDLTVHKRITAIVEDEISKFHIPYIASGDSFFVSSQDPTDILSVTNITSVDFIDYSTTPNQGDYLIISHPQLYDDGTGANRVEEYRIYRSSVAGGSHSAIIADINQLYDQFAYGIRKHPLAIRNFAMYAKNNFADEPQNMLLIGKSYSYNYVRSNSLAYSSCLVPTFGHPGADNLLTAPPGSVVPAIPVGRLTTLTGDEVRKYYEKVIEYEASQAESLQTVENKAWMKNVLHFAGGNTAYEQDLFDSYLNQYANIISDTFYGANVYEFNKLSTDPIFYSESEYIDSLINNGVSLITFFGHSSSNSFDYNIGNPAEFENTGKYFTVYGNGCNTSAIHGYDITLTEDYIFAENRSAIAFIAASNFSLASSLNNYATWFYREASVYNYDNTIGAIMQAAADSLWPTANIFDQITIEHTSLQGDPVLNLNNHEKPDYAIEPQYVYFEPEIISASVDSFSVNVVVTNIGKAIDASYYVEVKRTKADGLTEILLERFQAPYFRDTVTIKFSTDVINGIGLNTFNIHVDKSNEIDELDEVNNILTANTSIISDDAIPVYPYEFSILNHIPEYLAASTADAFASEKQYIFEIDTTMNFNSTLKKSTAIIESGGVIKWPTPPVSWLNNKVYYWRVSLDTLYDNNLFWRSSSFLYLPGDLTGWNQSHYFQYLEDEYNNVGLMPSRTFEFVNDLHTYEISTSTAYWYDVISYLDGELAGIGSCASNGFVVFIIDPNTGMPWTTSEVGDTGFGPYGDVYCSSDPYEQFIQFETDDADSRATLYNFLMNTVPDSAYVILYSNGYPQFNEWNDDEAILGYTLFDAFTALGATEILSLATYDFDRSYIFYAQKGDTTTAFELIGDETGVAITATFEIEGSWNEGSIETPLIGPAYNWDKVQWDLFSNDAIITDENGVDIIGVDSLGAEIVLATNLQSGDTSVAYINADIYSYVKLRLNTFDDSIRTPAQINYWRVIYVPVPEAALNPNILYSFHNDTVQQGETISLQIAVTNVSDYDMDSLLIDYSIRDQGNALHDIPYIRQDSLLIDETMIYDITFNSYDIPAGRNTIIIEVNPANDQPEQFHFNNVGYIQFYNSGDIQNPLLDVTFDGIHIFDGDIISAKPNILISMKDENQFLGLSDTSLLNISIKYPDESTREFYYDGETTKFYPADTNNLSQTNTARVEITPVFDMDGIYELHVHGEDAAGNNAGNIDYRITFEVINKPMISNVFNYPNPFTTKTHFVFTLTGSEVPEYFKIQIITVSGKVIREIMRNELGELHIGNNITEFTWDGTDEFGDAVGNGLYLYRVVTKLNGQKLDKYDTQTDQYFKSGFGKMYLVR